MIPTQAESKFFWLRWRVKELESLFPLPLREERRRVSREGEGEPLLSLPVPCSNNGVSPLLLWSARPNGGGSEEGAARCLLTF